MSKNRYEYSWNEFDCVEKVIDTQTQKVYNGCEIAVKLLNKQHKKIAELEKQLAESEKSKESFKVMYFNKCLDYEHLHEKFDDKCAEFELKEYDYKQTIFEKNQDKIDFAIEQLEKVKKYADIDFRKNCYIDAVGLDKFIDKQIKELKGEENV